MEGVLITNPAAA